MRPSPLIGHVVFWMLIIWTWSADGFTPAVRNFLALWAAGYVGLTFVPSGSLWFGSYVALLDVAMVLVFLKGDVRLR